MNILSWNPDSVNDTNILKILPIITGKLNDDFLPVFDYTVSKNVQNTLYVLVGRIYLPYFVFVSKPSETVARK